VTGREQLLALPFDPELAPGARNAVVHCLRIRPEEKVTLITDRACLEIAAALAHELPSFLPLQPPNDTSTSPPAPLIASIAR